MDSRLLLPHWPTEIETTPLCFVLHLGERGTHSCMAHCEHCFLKAKNPATIEYISTLDRDLKKQGYDTLVLVPDTFGEEGRWLKSGLLKNNQLYDQGEISNKGVAWTSGRPLLHGNWRELLKLAVDNNLEIISFTVPVQQLFSGMPTESELGEAIGFVKLFNKENPSHPLLLSLTFTIGSENCQKQHIRKMFECANSFRADMVRFNRFIDTTPTRKFAHLMMDQKMNGGFYKNLITTKNEAAFEKVIMISSDFGTTGCEAFGENVRFDPCLGGIRLFSIVGENVYPCVELLNTPVGKVVYSHDGYCVEFYEDALNRLERLIKDELYDGCIGSTSICISQNNS